MPNHYHLLERIEAEGADSRFSVYGYDPITGANITGINFYDININQFAQVVEITGRRLQEPNQGLPFWYFSGSGWDGYNSSDIGGGGIYLPPRKPQPIDLLRHIEDTVLGVVTSSDPLRKSVPINVLLTGANIFMEMMDNSRIGDIQMSQLAIP